MFHDVGPIVFYSPYRGECRNLRSSVQSRDRPSIRETSEIPLEEGTEKVDDHRGRKGTEHYVLSIESKIGVYRQKCIRSETPVDGSVKEEKYFCEQDNIILGWSEVLLK